MGGYLYQKKQWADLTIRHVESRMQSLIKQKNLVRYSGGDVRAFGDKCTELFPRQYVLLIDYLVKNFGLQIPEALKEIGFHIIMQTAKKLVCGGSASDD